MTDYLQDTKNRVADAVGSQSEVEFDLASLRLVRIRPGNPEVDR